MDAQPRYRSFALAIAFLAQSAAWLLMTIVPLAARVGLAAIWVAALWLFAVVALPWLTGLFEAIDRRSRTFVAVVGGTVAWLVGVLTIVSFDDAPRAIVASSAVLAGFGLAAMSIHASRRVVLVLWTLFTLTTTGIVVVLALALGGLGGGAGGLHRALASWGDSFVTWSPVALGDGAGGMLSALAFVLAGVIVPWATARIVAPPRAGANQWRALLIVVPWTAVLLAAALVVGWSVRALYGEDFGAMEWYTTSPLVLAARRILPPSLTAAFAFVPVAMGFCTLAGALIASFRERKSP